MRVLDPGGGIDREVRVLVEPLGDLIDVHFHAAEVRAHDLQVGVLPQQVIARGEDGLLARPFRVLVGVLLGMLVVVAVVRARRVGRFPAGVWLGDMRED